MNRNIEAIREKFDSYAPTWDESEPPFPEKLASLLDKIPLTKAEKILDLACGTGVLSALLQQRFQGEVLGLDLSPKMIEIARKKHANSPKISFECGDFYEYEGGKFDLIVLHNGYPHFLDVPALRDKAASLLRPHGILAVLHSCGREFLNSHHHAHIMNISFLLGTPEEEAAKFAPQFVCLSQGETSDSFFFILEPSDRL